MSTDLQRQISIAAAKIARGESATFPLMTFKDLNFFFEKIKDNINKTNINN